MDFKTFFFAKTVLERDEFAAKAGTSRGLLTQVAYGNKRVELGFADVIVALSKGSVDLDGIGLTENAERQRELRGEVIAAGTERRTGDRRSAGRRANDVATGGEG